MSPQPKFFVSDMNWGDDVGVSVLFVSGSHLTTHEVIVPKDGLTRDEAIAQAFEAIFEWIDGRRREALAISERHREEQLAATAARRAMADLVAITSTQETTP